MALERYLNFRVDPKLDELIRKAARVQHRTVSNYIRLVVARAVITDLASVEDDKLVDHDNGN